ncbi:hypothetical protein [Micrococcoides hystricis]|uniref:Uncharacterized protein n=1 Tax=Micrococcoides hystricis TaxID=1572761 RepID=A0ABV6P7L7_9MICC
MSFRSPWSGSAVESGSKAAAERVIRARQTAATLKDAQGGTAGSHGIVAITETRCTWVQLAPLIPSLGDGPSAIGTSALGIGGLLQSSFAVPGLRRA